MTPMNTMTLITMTTTSTTEVIGRKPRCGWMETMEIPAWTLLIDFPPGFVRALAGADDVNRPEILIDVQSAVLH